MKRLFKNSTINKCCMDSKNMELQSGNTPDIRVSQCRVCGRRHYGMTADPGELNLTGKEIG